MTEPTYQVQTNMELCGVPFPDGAEWDAGQTSSVAAKPGRYTVMRQGDDFVILFNSHLTRERTELYRYRMTEDGSGERFAKIHALWACRNGFTNGPLNLNQEIRMWP